MIPSHKRILLQGFSGHLGANNANDNVCAVCADGSGLSLNAMVLAAVAPWLKDALTFKDPDESLIILPDVQAANWNIFATNLVQDKDFFHISEVQDLRKACSEVCDVLQISDLNLDTGEATFCGFEVLDNPHDLEDQTVIDNFSDQDNRLVCLVCYKIFENSDCDEFRHHLTTHPKSSLKKIQVKKSREYLFKCNHCDFKAGTMEVVFSHHASCHPAWGFGAVFSCLSCDYTSTTYPQIASHLRVHQERKFECKNCHKKFLQKSSMKLHEDSKSCTEEKRTCSHCNKTFMTINALRFHEAKLKSKTKFECQVCKKQFKEKRSLKEHYLTHRRERQNVCQICQKAYVQKNHLLQHMASVHNTTLDGKTVKHVCKICSQSFAFPYLLKRHEASHVERIVNHFKTAEAEMKQEAK